VGRAGAEANGSERSEDFEGVKGGESLSDPGLPPCTWIIRHGIREYAEMRKCRMKVMKKFVLVGWFGLRMLRSHMWCALMLNHLSVLFSTNF